MEIDWKRIFVGSLEKKTHASVRQKFLKFKAWLSSDLFYKQFPVHYNEILNALPLLIMVANVHSHNDLYTQPVNCAWKCVEETVTKNTVDVYQVGSRITGTELKPNCCINLENTQTNEKTTGGSSCAEIRISSVQNFY